MPKNKRRNRVVDESALLELSDVIGNGGKHDRISDGEVAVQPSSINNAIVDPGFSSVQDDDDVEMGHRERNHSLTGGAVSHKGLTIRKCRALSCCSLVFIVILVLFGEAMKKQQKPAPSACDAMLSPPYTRNRTIGKDLCVAHQPVQWQNTLIKDFLLPSENTGKPSSRFLVVGDFGRDGWCCQRDVAMEMDRVGKGIASDFVINTGDSFYHYGIMSSTDEQVRTSFLNVYNQQYLKTMEFFSVLGNHEYRGSAEAVLQLSKDHLRFTMDSRWYSKTFEARGLAVHFIFIDTTPMISSYSIPGYDDPDSTMLKRTDGIPSQWSRVEEQMAWIERRLQNDKLPFNMKIVIGHHPIYDLSGHQGENRTFLHQRLAPLLEQYNVTAYFSGHDHNLQLIKPGKTAHFVSGAGSKVQPGSSTPDTPQEAVQFYYLANGFLACTAFNNELRVAVVDLEGNMLDSVVLKV